VDLGGRWAAAQAEGSLRRDFARPELDDAGWERVLVPGPTPGLSGGPGAPSGPVLYRRRFQARLEGQGKRAFLVVHGVCSQSDVWLDGSYLGDTEGYFFPHSFEVTAALSERTEHLLALEVTPGGIWAPVELETTGPVRLAKLRLACQEASASRAVLQLWAVLDSSDATNAELVTEVRLGGEVYASLVRRLSLASGANRARWRVEVPGPQLWWPAGFGSQPLYEVTVRVQVGGEESHSRALTTGLRQARVSAMVFQVNGEKLFLMGTDLVEASPGLAPASGVRAHPPGLNFFRVKGHVARSELYDAADESGLLLWQDLPARRWAEEALWLLAHHPSVVVWRAAPPSRGMGGAALRRVVERADPSRPCLSRPVRSTYRRLMHWAVDSQEPAVAAARLGRLSAIWPAAVRFGVSLNPPAPPASPPAPPTNLRAVIEGLRRLRLRPTGGFSVAGPVAGTLAGSFAPLHAIASWPRPSYRAGATASFALHVVNELTSDITDMSLEVRLTWPGGGRLWRLAGRAPASCCTYAGNVAVTFPRSLAGPAPWPVRIDLVLLRGDEVVSRNGYETQLSPLG
jgi:hypothetical protein